MRILMLCELVERIAECLFNGLAQDEMEFVNKTLHAIKVGMGDMKE